MPPGLNASEAIPFLAYVLKNGPFWLPKKEHHLAKCYAAICLGMTKDSAALEPLVEALKTTDENETREYVAMYAAAAVRLLGDPNAVQPLIEALHDERVTIRDAAMWSLGRLGDLRAIEPIIEKLKVRQEILDSQQNVPTKEEWKQLADKKRKTKEETEELKRKLKKYKENLQAYSAVRHLDKILIKITKAKLAPYEDDNYYKAWSNWWQGGQKLTKLRFHTIHSKWKDMKKETESERYVAGKQFLKMVDLGIPALPFMIEKVQQGEKEFISAISMLTGGKLKKTSTRAECLDWWNKNKQKWLIPFGEKIKVVVVTGGHAFERKPFFTLFEGYDDIEYVEAQLKDDSEIFEDVSEWDYDVMVLFNMTQKISPKRQENFAKLVQGGVGVVALHHSMGSFQDWGEYRNIIGGKYYTKPTEENGVTRKPSTYKHDVDFKIHIEGGSHPVTRGVSDFVVHDETYKNCGFEWDSRDNYLLLTTEHPTSDRQLGWVRQYGKGKVCFIMVGHGPSVYANESYRRLVAQAIRWCAD